jgi:acyl carrier protein
MEFVRLGAEMLGRFRGVAGGVRRHFSTHNPASFLAQDDVAQRVQTVVSNFIPTSARAGDHFVAKLGLDRLAVKQIIQELSTEFCVDISFSDANRITSMETATEYFSHHPKAR